MRKALWALVFALLVVGTASAQQTSIQVIGEGEARATFVFGHEPNGQPGETQLVVRCDKSQGWLITNFYTSQQAASAVFALSCSGSGPGPFVVLNTPFTFTNLAMYDSTGHQVGTVNLTVDSANFAQHYRAPDTGSASITVQ